ncbi:hypothetical protein [Caldivirga maquilingensis]|uniref:Uncharacterized protein n=1 Tax=Caldivirga maquilingensis (strain ATCC 700844 / DSM 13496 / JCM 10307 / IC-167) TaxID=397948 RepID=A8MCX4_CALMQ|nr:hypothetical protein [Caldivirga maquilingensis]ABW01630.1 hypothetical protein Cmaq_0795 [Caldivirga maquilingensis IC-167]
MTSEGRRIDLPHKFMELSPSARIITSYLQFENMINGKEYVTFNDIVENTGLSQRAVRGALSELKAKGIIEVILDVSRGRRYLYKLIPSNITIVEEQVESGLYLVDVGVGLPSMMSFRVYRAIRASAIVYYTSHVPQSFLEYTKCTCASLPLEGTKPEQLVLLIGKVVSSGGSIAIVYDQLLDWELLEQYIKLIKESGIGPIKPLSSVSPLTLGIQLLMSGSNETLAFKRGNISIRLIRVNPNDEVKNVNKSLLLKVFEIRRINELIEIRQLSNLDNLSSDYERVMVIYEVVPKYPVG